MMRDATIDDIPDWFWTAETYQKELGLSAWPDELDARILSMTLTLDTGFDLTKIDKPSVFWNNQFVNVVIMGERGEKERLPPPPPIRDLSHECTDDNHIKIHECKTYAGNYSFPYPLLLNLNYSKQTLMNAFGEFLDNAMNRFDHETYSKDNLNFVTKKLCSGVEKRVFKSLGKQYQGSTPYTQKHAIEWQSNCVLEYIDLFLWGQLNDFRYSEKLLASVFWHSARDRPFKYNPEKDHLTVKRSVRPWACELLNRRAVERIRAEATQKK